MAGGKKAAQGPVNAGTSSPSSGEKNARRAKRPLTPKAPVTAKPSPKEKADVTAEYEAALEDRKNQHYVLRLYIAGNNLRSRMAVENVKKVCEEFLKGRYELDVVDIYQDHSKNPVDLVLAAPTLVKRLPLPLRKVIGDMTRKEKVLVGLDLVPRTQTPP
jgi:circadian clock protein KaiB